MDVHHVTLKPLKPSTTYYFSIISGDKEYMDGNQAYKIAVPAVLTTPPPPKTLYGSVVDTSGARYTGRAAVTIQGTAMNPISVLVNPATGNWAASISTARTPDLKGYVVLSDSTPISINIEGGNRGSSTITTTVGQSSPAPTLELSNQPTQSGGLREILDTVGF